MPANSSRRPATLAGRAMGGTQFLSPQRVYDTERWELTVGCNFADSEGCPVQAENLVGVGNGAAVECAQDLLCGLVRREFHKSVPL